MNIRLTCGAVLLVVIAVAGCRKQSAEKELGPGKLEGQTYTHDYFNLKLTVPANWYIFNKSDISGIAGEVEKELVGANSRRKKEIEQSRNNTAYLFAAFRFNAKSEPATNFGVTVVAERIAGHRNVKTAVDYLNEAVKTMQRGQKVINTRPIERGQRICGMTMDCMPIETPIDEGTVKQRFYAAIVKDYALVIVVTYFRDTELKEVLAVLNQ